MTPQALEKYQTHLLQIKDSLINELETIAIYHPETDDWEVRINDEHDTEADDSLQGDQSEAADERVATLALLETRYRNVVRALNKITDGTYGICEFSGHPIEPERLEANPAARTCIADREREEELPL